MDDLVSLTDAVDHAIKQGELTPHQRAAINRLNQSLSTAQRTELTEGWRSEGSPASSANPSGGVRQLAVPYLAQRDSATRQGDRMCFSSTCAMAAQFLKPGCLSGPNQPDDTYLSIVNKYGDTTDASAQVQALEWLGIKASFRQDGRIEDLARLIAGGVPVPVGWLHRGSVSAPSGGGHWSLAVGWDPATRQVIMHDPYGEADLVRGGYVTLEIGSGRGQRYSAENWGRRWMAGPVPGSYKYTPGTGWYIELKE